MKSSFTGAFGLNYGLDLILAYESLYASAVMPLLLLSLPPPCVGKENHRCLLDNTMEKVKIIFLSLERK